MPVKQLSVFIENSMGSLSRLTGAIGDAGIDLIALSVADTENYGIARCITRDTEKTAEVLRSVGYTVRQTDVLAVCVPNKAGGLADILNMLEKEKISLDYLYSFFRAIGQDAWIVLRIQELDKAIDLMSRNNIRMLTQEEISAL